MRGISNLGKAIIGGIFVIILAQTLLVATFNGNQPTATPSIPQSVMQNVQTPTPTPEVKTFKVAEIGNSLTDSHLQVTLNAVNFTDRIASQTVPNLGGELGTEVRRQAEAMLTQTPKTNNTYLVVDVTVENKDKIATSISSVMQFNVKDDDGYAYTIDMMATSSLAQLIDGTVQPGDKVRGKLVFQIPKTAKNLQLVFNFDDFGYAQAKFNLQQKT